jgi:hypothetical protein
MRNLSRKSKKVHKRKFANIDKNVWNLEYDPWAHSENEELYLLSYPENCHWDVFNIRCSIQVGAFHIGMKFRHIRTGTTKTVVDYINPLGFHAPVLITEYAKKEQKDAQIC